MKNNLLGETLISIILVGLLVFYLDPFEPMMPKPMHMIMIPLVIILFVFLAAFLWRETPGDEREQLHKFIASRIAYFVGTLTLIIAFIYQSLHHTIDNWIIITVCVMLLGKILASLYAKVRK
jgi:hypothetical protein